MNHFQDPNNEVESKCSPKGEMGHNMSHHQSHHYYNTSISMLPPPPPAPMARPVPIIRSPIDSCSPELGVNSSPSPPTGRSHHNGGHDSGSVTSVVVQHVRDDSVDGRVSSPQTSSAMSVNIGDSIGGPGNRSVMNSPFTTLSRHDFAHVSHHSVSQVFPQNNGNHYIIEFI